MDKTDLLLETCWPIPSGNLAFLLQVEYDRKRDLGKTEDLFEDPYLNKLEELAKFLEKKGFRVKGAVHYVYYRH